MRISGGLGVLMRGMRHRFIIGIFVAANVEKTTFEFWASRVGDECVDQVAFRRDAMVSAGFLFYEVTRHGRFRRREHDELRVGIIGGPMVRFYRPVDLLFDRGIGHGFGRKFPFVFLVAAKEDGRADVCFYAIFKMIVTMVLRENALISQVAPGKRHKAVVEGLELRLDCRLC